MCRARFSRRRFVLPFVALGLILGTHASARAGSAPAFADPVSVAVGRAGTVYVFERGTSSITVLSPRGQTLATWPVPAARSFPGPGALAVDGAGRLSVLLGNSRRGRTEVGGIEQLSPAGRVLTRRYDAALLNASLLAADAAGDVFTVVPVALRGGAGRTARIVKLARDGRITAGRPLPTAGHDLLDVVGIAADTRGNVYLSAAAGSCSRGCQGREADLIERFTPSGAARPLLRYPAGTVAAAPGLAVDTAGALYTAGSAGILRISPAGAVTTHWGEGIGCGALQFRGIAGLAVDGRNVLYALDESNDNLHQLNLRTGTATLWGGCPATPPPLPTAGTP